MGYSQAKMSLRIYAQAADFVHVILVWKLDVELAWKLDVELAWKCFEPSLSQAGRFQCSKA